MNERKRVYVAGPYTKGDVAINVRTAIEAADTLLHWGYLPHCPHLTHFWHLVCPRPYETWLDYDKAWLRLCDAVVRLPGDSQGADQEVALARELGIPVYGSLMELLDRFPPYPMDHETRGRMPRLSMKETAP